MLTSSNKQTVDMPNASGSGTAVASASNFKPLGHPQRYCVKNYSRDVLAQQLVDVGWLDKLVAAIHRHWRNKNARNRAKQANNGAS